MTSYCYLSVKDIVNDKSYPFTQGQLRHFMINRETNGLNDAVRKIGKRLYVRRDLFDEWIEKVGKE